MYRKIKQQKICDEINRYLPLDDLRKINHFVNLSPYYAGMKVTS